MEPSEDYDEIDMLIDTDPIALGARCRRAEARVAVLEQEVARETSERMFWEARSIDLYTALNSCAGQTAPDTHVGIRSRRGLDEHDAAVHAHRALGEVGP